MAHPDDHGPHRHGPTDPAGTTRPTDPTPPPAPPTAASAGAADPTAPIFRPRLDGSADGAAPRPPFNPKAYYLVAFFAGPLALAAVAVLNLDRIARSDETRRRTWQLVGLVVAASVAFLALSPESWWEPVRNIRFGLRGLAVVAALGLDRVHRGPAFAAASRARDFTSMWKAIGPILLAAVALAVVTVGVAIGRGVPIG